MVYPTGFEPVYSIFQKSPDGQTPGTDRYLHMTNVFVFFEESSNTPLVKTRSFQIAQCKSESLITKSDNRSAFL